MKPKRTTLPAGRDVIRLDDFLPYRVTVLAHRLSLTAADLLAARPRLTLQEWKVMAIVADRGPLTPVAIRRRGTQDKSTVSWAIKRLKRRGLVATRPKDGDGRTFDVALTEPGWKYYGAIVPKSRRRAAATLGRLSPAEARTLKRLVDELLAD